MAGSTSGWHTSDVVAYDVMRDLGRSVMAALMLGPSNDGESRAKDEARAIHDRVMQVDAHDRVAVDEATIDLLTRWSELNGDRHG